ncbi:dynactin 25 kDa subunit [Dictyostelium purpureum]|uniref:Dynactin subunit 5 n=1 Tax=Dictyostelium purpureum TaxID=5786 RepID=F0ZX44_DICPU|nr:dynactin 25 kDa subunit [Dictyostelium purpureum]EGC31477.1 dynactin 25 kDa subunit [Dictyostelium purpureum]|eukprot:XP_003291982.1 dynactin 25 kDa subunit [Dictyostelium purpureum]
MQTPPTYFEKSQYIETLNGNKVSKSSILCGIMNIRLHGKTIIKPGVIVRGDLATVNIGRLSIVSENTVIRPSSKKFKGSIVYFPQNIGDHVFIGEGCVISAASIGSQVYIGKNCIISKRCILKDCCIIEDGTILPPDTVVPPFTYYSGVPGVYKEDLPDCTDVFQKDYTTSLYESFLPNIPKPSTSGSPIKPVTIS